MPVRPTDQAGGYAHGGDAPERNETSDSKKRNMPIEHMETRFMIDPAQ